MTVSPKKYVTNFTSSTTNRGVEATENNIKNARMDLESTSEVAAAPESVPPIDESASYIQVVVQKRGRTEAPTARVPRASSPLRGEAKATDANVLLLQRPLLLSYAAPQWYAGGDTTLAPAGAVADTQECKEGIKEQTQESSRKKLNESVLPKYDVEDNGPERVEVYYFERSTGDFLATSDFALDSAVDRAARRAARQASSIMATVFAVPRLALSAPLAVLLQVERCGLLVLRGFGVGAVQILSDYTFKPLLTLLFNAVLQPPLVLVAQTARSFRSALRPFWWMVGDAIEPIAKLLQAVRLVNVQIQRDCECACAARRERASPC